MKVTRWLFFFYLGLSLFNIKGVMAQVSIFEMEPGIIHFESWAGNDSGMDTNSVVSNIQRYSGGLINTKTFIRTIKNAEGLQGSYIKVRPPELDDMSELHYAMIYLSTIHQGMYYHGISIVFIDQMITGEPVYYLDFNLDNVFDESPVQYLREDHVNALSFQQNNSSVVFKLLLHDVHMRVAEYLLNNREELLHHPKELSHKSNKLNSDGFNKWPNGFFLYYMVGTGGGGRNQYTIAAIDNPDFSITHKYEFRSQNLSLGLQYWIQHFFLAAFISAENIQPQNGRRKIQRSPGNHYIEHGLTNYFPKQRAFWGAEVGYSLNLNKKNNLGIYTGYSSYSYLGDKRYFNDEHLKRHSFFSGLKISFPFYSGRTVAFLNTSYARHFFQHATTVQNTIGSVGETFMTHQNIKHQQINIGIGLMHNLNKKRR